MGVVARAIKLCKLLEEVRFPVPTTATATRSGGILFVWEQGPDYKEIEIVGQDRIEWMAIGSDNKAEHGEISLPPTGRAWHL
jgi:hypothetical protein